MSAAHHVTILGRRQMLQIQREVTSEATRQLRLEGEVGYQRTTDSTEMAPKKKGNNKVKKDESKAAEEEVERGPTPREIQLKEE